MSWTACVRAPSVASVSASLLSPAGVAAALAGLGIGFSMIVAIGAQNAFVLRQGIRREHVIAVVAICALSDIVLISAGIAGTGWVIGAVPWLLTAIRIGGAVFLATYGVLAARRALRPSQAGLEVDEADRTVSRRRSLVTAVATTLAVTWLNPHVYLDIAILGSIANTYGDAAWLFGLGIAVASVTWFTTLGLGARALAPLFARPLAWRILDGVIALVMLGLAVLVALPLVLE